MKKILKKERGYLLVYFLIIASVIAIVWTAYARKQRVEVERSVKEQIINQAINEVKWNLSGVKRYRQMVKWDEKFGINKFGDRKIIFKTHSIKFFISRMFTAFKVSRENRLKLEKIVDRLRFYNILNEKGNTAEIDKNYLNEIEAIYKELNLIMERSKKYNYNLTFYYDTKEIE